MPGRTIIPGSRWRPYMGAVPPPNPAVPAHIPFRAPVVTGANPRFGGRVVQGRMPRAGVVAAGPRSKPSVVVALRRIPVIMPPRIGRIPRANPAVPASRPRPAQIRLFPPARPNGRVIVGRIPRYGVTVGGGGAALIDHVLLTDELFADNGAIASPVVNTWYNLDLAWGWQSGHDPAAMTTVFSCGGASIDTTFEARYHGHVVSVGNRAVVDLGNHPDGTPVYLSPYEAAAGWWRISFPSAGLYVGILSGVGNFYIAVSGSSMASISPTITILHPNPLNRQPSKLLRLDFTGTYPSGGLDLNGGQIGLEGMLFAQINDANAYRFSWVANKLRVFTANGEASGTISFTTTGLFLGLGG